MLTPCITKQAQYLYSRVDIDGACLKRSFMVSQIEEGKENVIIFAYNCCAKYRLALKIQTEKVYERGPKTRYPNKMFPTHPRT